MEDSDAGIQFWLHIVVKIHTTGIHVEKVHVYAAAVWDDADAVSPGLWFLSAQAGGPGGFTWGPGWALLQAPKDTDSNQLKSLELDKISLDNNKRPLFLLFNFSIWKCVFCGTPTSVLRWL